MEIKKIVVIGPESTGKSTLCAQLAEHYQTLWVPEYAREYLEKNGTDYSYNDLLAIAKGQIELEERMSDQLIAMSYELSDIRHQQLATNTKHQISLVPPSGGRGFLFIDTDMYVMKVWCEFVFNQCHNWILNQIATRHYDAYLLCDVDLPWIEDKLREYPNIKMREKLYHFYKDLMIHQSVPWCIISGDKEERLNKAISSIESSIH
ncbi:MAG TPA: ATP-binding protein [Hanamia sp.]|nr:ATP-binding protein [Hanamia sp.]